MLLFCYYDMYVHYIIMIFVSNVILDMSYLFLDILDIEEKKEQNHKKVLT